MLEDADGERHRLDRDEAVASGPTASLCRCGVVVVVIFICASCSPPPAQEHPGGQPLKPDAPGVPALTLQAAPPEGIKGRLVFHSNREGRHALYMLDVATGAIRRLTTGSDHNNQEPAWSPDGTQVAYTTTRFDRRTWDIAVMNAAGTDVRRVTTDLAPDRHAAWTPDGRSLLFSSEQDGTQAVFRAWLDTGRIARVSPPPDRALMPAVSPDGSVVAYTIGTPAGLRIVTQHLDGGDVRPLTPEGEDAAGPRWSPDGSRLVYERLTPGGSSLVILTLETGATLPLGVEGLVTLREPAWSPDGRWIAAAGSAATGVGQNWDLMVLQVEPSPAAFRLTSGADDDRAPSWIPR